MCIIKGAFVGEKHFDVIKMHGTTIKITVVRLVFAVGFSNLCMTALTT